MCTGTAPGAVSLKNVVISLLPYDLGSEIVNDHPRRINVLSYVPKNEISTKE